MQGSFFGTGRVDDKLVETDMLEFNASWVYLWENTFQKKIKFFSGVVSSWTFFSPSWNFSASLWWLVGKMSHGEVRPPHSHVGEEEELKCVLSLTVSPEKISACCMESVGRQNETEPSPSRISAYLWQVFAYVTSSLWSELTTYHCNVYTSKHGTCPDTRWPHISSPPKAESLANVRSSLLEVF